MRALVTGAAGVVGSHLVEALLNRGDEVVGVDNFLTGTRENLEPFAGHQRFDLIEADVCDGLAVDGEFDAVCHLASPASPADFGRLPREILRVGSVGTLETLELALRSDARYLMASTSEVYGEPTVHPQPEHYRGNVNTVGPRACYDEAKRFAEAAASSYARSFGLSTSIARIFNTYGPRMRPDDGRVVPNFVVRALSGEPLVIHGDGTQTRSFCFVEDEVEGLLLLLDSDLPGPVNIGNSDEVTMIELAHLVLELTGSSARIEFGPRPENDPMQRCPDTTFADLALGWSPQTKLRDGLARTIEYFRGLRD
jgi:nucleoside-diphosphate-sugar epimerase